MWWLFGFSEQVKISTASFPIIGPLSISLLVYECNDIWLSSSKKQIVKPSGLGQFFSGKIELALSTIRKWLFVKIFLQVNFIFVNAFLKKISKSKQWIQIKIYNINLY